jgi:hypothetical protein
MLLTSKAYIEGMRALAYWVGQLIDIEEKHPDEAARAEASDLVALMTPVIKAFLTDVGFDVANLGLQCLGGHGYIREFGLEQFVRDARIAQIYEGTNGVQAMDLLGRKIPDGGGRMLRRFIPMVQATAKSAQADPRLTEMSAALLDALRKLQESTMTVMNRAAQNPNEVGAAATDYLRLLAVVATGWMWLRMAQTALAKQGNGNDAFLDAKVKTARFYFAKLLPQVSSLAASIAAGSATVMEMDVAGF